MSDKKEKSTDTKNPSPEFADFIVPIGFGFAIETVVLVIGILLTIRYYDKMSSPLRIGIIAFLIVSPLIAFGFVMLAISISLKNISKCNPSCVDGKICKNNKCVDP